MEIGKTAALFFLCVAAFAALTGCRPESSLRKTVAGGERKAVSKITVLAGQSSTDPGIEEILSEAVEKELPEIELFWERMDWGEQFDSQMQMRFSAGEIPDIMIGKAQDIRTYAPSGYLSVISDDLASYIRPGILSSVSLDGKVYGIPYNAFYQGVIYNRDIFEKYNLDVPENMAELERISTVLKSENVVPFASHFKEIWYTANIFMQMAMSDLFRSQPDWGDLFRRGTTSFSLSHDMENCIRSIRFIYDNSWDDAMAVNLIECDERFAHSRAAMYLTGTWSLQNIESVNSDLRIGVFPYPGDKERGKLLIEPNLTFMKSAVSPHSESIDRIFNLILEDVDLSMQITDYTKTASVVRNMEPNYPPALEKDILAFEENDRIIDVTLGNSQLRWTFQETLARDILSWLKGEIPFEQVMANADRNRPLSAVQ